MLGINSQPYIDISSYIDVETLKNMHKEICLGIAKSRFETTIYGFGLDQKQDQKSFAELAVRYKNSLNNDDKEIFNSLNWNQRSIFFKLYEDMYNASKIVLVRDLTKRISEYYMKGSSSHTKLTDNAIYFPNLLKWIYDLPIFDDIGRIIFFLNEHDCPLQLHMDAPEYRPHRDEFVWLNPTGKKKFYIYNPENKEKIYIRSSAAFFNSLDWHGGDAIPTYTYSLRVDGKFTEKFRQDINIAHLEQY
jgi:hypothetical protein